MMEISEDHEKFLLALFESTDGDPSTQVSMYDVGTGVGLENTESSRMAEELMGFGLVEVRTLSGGIAISGEGVEAVKRLGGVPGDGDGGGYQLSSEAIISEPGIQEVEQLTVRLKKCAGNLGLVFEPLAELVADLRTIDAQLASARPKSGIVLECFRSIAGVLQDTGALDELAKVRQIMGTRYMAGNYANIVRENLDSVYGNLQDRLQEWLPAVRSGDQFEFRAFGRRCRVAPEGILLDGEAQDGVLGILISLYLRHAAADPVRLKPLVSFKDLPNSMPYVGAFATHTQRVLEPHVELIARKKGRILDRLEGVPAPSEIDCDLSFLIYPLPKIALCYIFYFADDDFPASVTCLYSNNASRFLPTDALADVGEYTSKTIIGILEA